MLILVAHRPGSLVPARNTYMVVGSLLVTCIIGFIFVGYQAAT